MRILQAGGTAAPKLAAYHEASLLAHILAWSKASPDRKWSEIEQALLPQGVCFRDLIWIPKHTRNLEISQNFIISSNLKFWDKIRHGNGIAPHASPIHPVSGFVPYWILIQQIGWYIAEFSSPALAIVFLCVSCVYLLQKRKKGTLPPGPKALPVIGNLHQLDTKDMVTSLKKLSEIYGPVFTIYLGPSPSVVLYGYKVVKEALVEQGDIFSGRGDVPVLHDFTKGNGIAFSNGEKWKNLRRFALSTLRNFGMGKKSIEARIQEEAQYLTEEFRRTKGALFDPTLFISRAVSNVICSVVFGDRFDYEDKRFLTLLSLINDNFQLMSSAWGTFYNIFPGVMRHLPGRHNQIFKNFNKLKDFVLEMMKSHQETFQPNCPRDFIDCFLAKMQKEKDNPLSDFNTETLVMTTHNLFFGGTETVSTTLRYGFLILMKYPDIAEKVHKEIDQVIGRNQRPTVEDRSRMPYTDAVIHEIQRFTSIIPLNLPHSITQDTNFRGFMLPKGTNIIPVLSSVHNDPTKFKDPAKFDPHNFLDENNKFQSNEAFMPFSSGKRICLGESLARMELFIFFTTILQNFTFLPTQDPDQIDLNPSISGLGNVPPSYQFYAILH
ncbi:cytochrome P450 2F2-like [Bombina bombina]|uniref:cytochrome P450 2F2-like n=1 Tax=Bombina bombina TaxID=8345 RepID=UPI00235A928B|nr:cytochrome P450 2F2-like [Bombina bombina]